MSRVRVFLAVSVDGFIAGPNQELDWLTPESDVEDTFTPFLADIGVLLMGRRTHDVVSGFSGPWPYGEIPLVVATHRPLQSTRATVEAVAASITDLLLRARERAGKKDIYLDGGTLVQQALAADLVDEITLTFIPVLLGKGISLFRTLEARRKLSLVYQRALGGGLVQVRYEVIR